MSRCTALCEHAPAAAAASTRWWHAAKGAAGWAAGQPEQNGAARLLAQSLRRQGRASWASDWPSAGPHQLPPLSPPQRCGAADNKSRAACIEPATGQRREALRRHRQIPHDVVTRFRASYEQAGPPLGARIIEPDAKTFATECLPPVAATPFGPSSCSW